ncbi:LapA family protein [Thalassotalea sp. M1531]|uniref:LapA family protein n=2 Tax=Thalassotalea algicola TaxID=2716224 RepID=A0A7Y0LBT3_9GAMM|nr:LapA family protein [Thalassotalea algicola]
MKLYFTIFVMFVLLIIAFIFGSQNEQLITLNYLIAKSNMPVAMAVSLFTMLGFVLGIVFMLFLKLLRPLKRKRDKG